MPKKKNAKTKITSKDVQSVAQKLDGFLKELPEQEQNVLGWILTRLRLRRRPTSRLLPRWQRLMFLSGLNPLRLHSLLAQSGWERLRLQNPRSPS